VNARPATTSAMSFMSEVSLVYPEQTANDLTAG
jgi:hypothetical protein